MLAQFRAAALLAAATLAAPAHASVLDLVTGTDPLMTVSYAAVEVDEFGELFVDGEIDGFTAGDVALAAPLEFTFSTLLAEINIFAPDALDDTLAGDLVEFDFGDGVLALLFDTSTDAEAVFGPQFLLRLSGPFTAASGSAPFFDESGTGVIASPAPIPLPATLPLALAGLAALGLLRRRA